MPDTDGMNRRDCLRVLGLSGLTVGLASARAAESPAPVPSESGGFQSSILAADKVEANRACPNLVNGKVLQPARELTVLDETDVLVVGGGSAGVVAALAARRAGARVTLVERYGHFGGLWTGGLVLLITGHIVKGKQVCQGIGEEIMRRLDKLDGAIIDRRPGAKPTVDAEAVKYLMVEMTEEAGVKVFLHCWAADAIMDGNTVRGVVFESKSGRQAIVARVVVDATGDGDIFAAAGARFEHRSHNVGLVHRIGNLDRVDPAKAAQGPKPKHLGSRTPVSGVNWVNMHGPEVDGLDVATLTRMEMSHRKFIWKNIQETRRIPGYEQVYLVETAPQLGVRITRVLRGLSTIKFSDVRAGRRFADSVGVGGADSGNHGEWQIPCGTLVPVEVDGILAAGRCISADISMADLVRLIPNCFVTGHAAGVAAAVAVRDKCRPRDVDVALVQKILRQQEAYLG
jgi:ribulose 1,5-bisphosphate synthetase/thiazole synthase